MVSSGRQCVRVSFSDICHTVTTYKRTSAFCKKPAGSLTGGIQAWYLYCYKTKG